MYMISGMSAFPSDVLLMLALLLATYRMPDIYKGKSKSVQLQMPDARYWEKT